MRKTTTNNKQNQQQQQQQQQQPFNDSIEKLKELMETEFFKDYSETDKKETIKALVKDLEG